MPIRKKNLRLVLFRTKRLTNYPAIGAQYLLTYLPRQVSKLSMLRRRIFPNLNVVRLRNDLANFKQRLKALQAKVAEDGIILTESQVQVLERKKQGDEACGEIDTVHPGYLGSQDTFYVGHFKGIGRVYQPTLRCRIYESIGQLQADLDIWLDSYNNECTHQGKRAPAEHQDSVPPAE